jgi:cell division protein ZapA
VSEVSLQIGGRAYKVACADGEEGHIRHLARIIDGKMAAVGNNAGVSEAQSLLFAALFLADELDEARRSGTAATGLEPSGDVAAETLEKVADRLEAFALALEKAP